MCAKPNPLMGASFSAEDWEKARALYEQLQPWLSSQPSSPQIEPTDAVDQAECNALASQKTSVDETIAAAKEGDAAKSSSLRPASWMNAACTTSFFLHQTLLPYLPPAWQKALVWYEAFCALSSFTPTTPPQGKTLWDTLWEALFETLPHA